MSYQRDPREIHSPSFGKYKKKQFIEKKNRVGQPLILIMFETLQQI